MAGDYCRFAHEALPARDKQELMPLLFSETGALGLTLELLTLVCIFVETGLRRVKAFALLTCFETFVCVSPLYFTWPFSRVFGSK